MTLSKNKIKLINSLSNKKNRENEGLFVVEGIKIVSEIMQSNLEIVSIFALESYFQTEKPSNKIDKNIISEKELKQISSLNTPNQVLALVKIPQIEFNILNFKNKLVLAFDNIQDPGNFGTIIRTAEWFGINNIICSKNSVDLYNSKVVQATMGAISRVNVFYLDLESVFPEFLKNEIPIYGTLLSGNNLYNESLSQNGIVLFGNESKGISKNLEQFVTKKIKIPASENNKTESLNISIATGIICAEFLRNKIKN
jgi:RNA methyltransferase, TrmH family